MARKLRKKKKQHNRKNRTMQLWIHYVMYLLGALLGLGVYMLEKW